MMKFMLIGAALLIAGAATVAVAADHKGSRKHAPAAGATSKHAPPAAASSRAAAPKAAAAKHPVRKHRTHAVVRHAKK